MVLGFADILGENSVMGIPVEHYLKHSENDYNVGENFRLNLNETFIKNSNSEIDANYVYTDGQGNVHGFKEYFYYLDDSGEKKYLDVVKNAISVEADGRLKYGDQVVEVEYRSITGLKAITNKEGYNNIKYFEQRSDEEKQLEEQIKGYKELLTSYKLLDTSRLPITTPVSCNISDIVKDWRNSSAEEIGKTEVENLLSGGTNQKLLLEESDALNYINIKNQRCFYDETVNINNETHDKVLMGKAALVLLAKQIFEECNNAYTIADSSTKDKLDEIKEQVTSVSYNEEITSNLIISISLFERLTFYLADKDGEIIKEEKDGELIPVQDTNRVFLFQKLVKEYNIDLKGMLFSKNILKGEKR